jgi:hypothetical protein
VGVSIFIPQRAAGEQSRSLLVLIGQVSNGLVREGGDGEVATSVPDIA